MNNRWRYILARRGKERDSPQEEPCCRVTLSSFWVSACNWKEIQNLQVIAVIAKLWLYYVFIDQEEVFSLHWFGLVRQTVNSFLTPRAQGKDLCCSWIIRIRSTTHLASCAVDSLESNGREIMQRVSARNSAIKDQATLQ